MENCLHMGQVRTGLRSSGKRLAQCSHVIVKVKKRFPMQVDGEPWEQPPGTVCNLKLRHIYWKNSASMYAFSEKKIGTFHSFHSHFQIEISHKNHVPMLVGPPPKSRSFFSFLTKELRHKEDDNFEHDEE